MDANKNIIPILSEDMGEGFMDPLDANDLKEIAKRNRREEMKRLRKQADALQKRMNLRK